MDSISAIQNGIKISSPQPYSRVRQPGFRVRGSILKEIYDDFYRLDVNLYNYNGCFYQGMSPIVQIRKSIFNAYRKKINFFFDVPLSAIENSSVFIIEIASKKGEYFLLPLIYEGTDKTIFGRYTSSDFKEALDSGIEKIKYRKKEWADYLKELGNIRSRVRNRKIWEDISNIIEESEENFASIDHLDEEEERRLIDEKYSEVIDWHGALLRGVAGRMNGFDFIVNSKDHLPKHFHIVHKGKGVHARFLYPEIELYDYKGGSNQIGSSEIKRIREYFSNPENFEALKYEFDKQIVG